MRAPARLLAALLACAASATYAAPTALAAAGLPVPIAAERSSSFAKRTCTRDQSCVRYGVLNCRRQGSTSVLCRIFNERRTRVQGRYRCNRLIRVSLEPRSRRMPVTGLGRWHC